MPDRRQSDAVEPKRVARALRYAMNEADGAPRPTDDAPDQTPCSWTDDVRAILEDMARRASLAARADLAIPRSVVEPWTARLREIVDSPSTLAEEAEGGAVLHGERGVVAIYPEPGVARDRLVAVNAVVEDMVDRSGLAARVDMAIPRALVESWTARLREALVEHGGVPAADPEHVAGSHVGDPCQRCGTPHDDVGPGPCLAGAASQEPVDELPTTAEAARAFLDAHPPRPGESELLATLRRCVDRDSDEALCRWELARALDHRLEAEVAAAGEPFAGVWAPRWSRRRQARMRADLEGLLRDMSNRTNLAGRAGLAIPREVAASWAARLGESLGERKAREVRDA